MKEVKLIMDEVKKGIIKPIYFLCGEEPYFIDQLTDFLEDNLLPEADRSFNQMVIYGRDVKMDEVISNAKRFPMMAERQVIIVREAQDLSKEIESLSSYLANIQPSTVLVFCYKYKTIDKRKSVFKTLSKAGWIFESKKLYENNIGSFIVENLHQSGYAIDPKATEMLVSFLGTDLGRISSELNKLKIVVPKNEKITDVIIERNIGISKDFNFFEFQKAIAQRNEVKAYQIAQYFAQNQKENPLVLTTAMLFKYFSNLMTAHGTALQSNTNLQKVLRLNYFAAEDCVNGIKNYPMRKVSTILEAIRILDVKSKGVDSNAVPVGDLLKEVLVKIFN
uniref:DNA polymerase III subunit delta n=2 Tax=Flavobacterium sp. TaxID=239 RepID=UPI00404B0C7D